MGCFSFICSECGEPINADEISGEHCILSLLQDNKVIEDMKGSYSGYGTVLSPNGEGEEWKMCWDDVCDLMFKTGSSDGINARHSDCASDSKPTDCSDNDPEQGWGEVSYRRDGNFEHNIYN